MFFSDRWFQQTISYYNFFFGYPQFYGRDVKGSSSSQALEIYRFCFYIFFGTFLIALLEIIA